MTEIEFLVSLLLNEKMEETLRNKLLVRIGEVEKARMAPYMPVTMNTPFIQTIPDTIVNPINLGCVGGSACEYPNPWMGIIPPHCKKCGKQATNWLTITNGTGDTLVGSTNGNVSINNTTDIKKVESQEHKKFLSVTAKLDEASKKGWELSPEKINQMTQVYFEGVNSAAIKLVK
jgi:hypothetical protein